jgi:3-oxoacid CoA-transferase A subunit
LTIGLPAPDYAAGSVTECPTAMPIDKRAASAAEAIADVADGATILISGFGGAGFPNVLIRALRDRGPKDLTLVVNSATHRYSLTHELIEAGLVRKVICTAARGHSKEPSAFERLWMDGKIELECVPQGTFTERIRAGGAGIPAFYTPVGFGTELTRGKEVRKFQDREYVLEQALTGDVALICADTADRYGNLSFRYAQMNFGPVMATAAKLAVAEVRTVLEQPMPHEQVRLPGVYIDRIVMVPK